MYDIQYFAYQVRIIINKCIIYNLNYDPNILDLYLNSSQLICFNETYLD
jgi:hypothetical protein